MHSRYFFVPTLILIPLLVFTATIMAASSALPAVAAPIISWEYDQLAPAVAYNAAAEEYLVVWEDHHWGWGDDWDIYGQRVNGDGTLAGSNFGISWEGANHRESPDVAYNPGSGEYLVSWEYEHSPDDHDVYRRRVGSDGTLLEGETAVSNQGTWEGRPALASDAAGAYLIVWEDGRNSGTQGLDIYGEVVDLLPDLVMESLAAEPSPVKSGEPVVFTAEVHNVGLVSVNNVPVRFAAAGEPFAEEVVDLLGANATAFISVTHAFSTTGQISVTATVNPDGALPEQTTIPELPAGDVAQLAVEWADISEGQHIIGVWIDPEDQVPDDSLAPGFAQSIVVPGANYQVASNVGLGHWKLIGPRSINNGAYSGRVDPIAISQQNSDNISIGTVGGGVWRTRDGGWSWWPQTDHLESPGIGAIALDPTNDTIIYAGSGAAYGGGSGLYKSLDEGAHWSKFAGTWLSDGFTSLILRYTQPTTLTIYAATRRGVWLWQGDPQAEATSQAQWHAIWQQIVAGRDQRVGDMLITAENPPQLYWTVPADSIYRVNANDPLHATVERLAGGLPADLSYANIGNSPADPDRVYAAVGRQNGTREIYRRDHSGNWTYRGQIPDKNCNPWLPYNAFVAVHPNNANILYVGGIKGCRSGNGGASFPYVIPNVHDDYKDFAFDPADANIVFFTSDGGVYRCRNNTSTPMDCVGLNHELATTMFFDIALTASDVGRTVGGTQDNGSIIGDNSLDWRNLSYGGDGKYMLVDPADRDVMFAQYQNINSVVSSTVAGPPWKPASNGLPTLNVSRYDPIMVMDPNDSHTLLLAGDQVYRTTNRGKQWNAIGPLLAIDFNGEIIRRTAIDGVNHRYYAGTNWGRLFTVTANDAGPMSWTQIYTHPYGSAIRGILVDSANPNALYLTAASGGAWRVIKLVHSGGWPGAWTPTDITGAAPAGLPGNRRVNGGPNDAIRGLIKHPSADILYIGTDRGVYEGRQVGSSWQWLPDTCGLPLTYVSDLELHPGGIMRAATYGRSAYERPTALLTISPDAYDTPTRNDTRATAAALPAVPEAKPLMPNLTVNNLNLDRLNDVDYFTIQLPPVTTSKGYAECLPAGDSRLNDPRTTQGAFAIEIHAPDVPDPYELRLYNPDGSLFKQYDAISNLTYVLTCPHDSFPSGQITLSIRSPTGCRGQYDLYIWYNRWVTRIDAPEILYDPPLIKRLIPTLDQFHWLFPWDPTLIDHRFTSGVTDPLPAQRAIFPWDHTRDFVATLTTEAGRALNVTLVDATGAPVRQASKAVKGPGLQQISVPNLPAGWYALDFENGDFPTYFDVSFNVVAGDYDGDCQVGVADLIAMAERWNSRVDEEGYDLQYDLNTDGAIDVADLLNLAARWGQTCP